MVPVSRRATRESESGISRVICLRMLYLKRDLVFFLSGMSHSEGVQPANVVRSTVVGEPFSLVWGMVSAEVVVLMLGRKCSFGFG